VVKSYCSVVEKTDVEKPFLTSRVTVTSCRGRCQERLIILNGYIIFDIKVDSDGDPLPTACVSSVHRLSWVKNSASRRVHPLFNPQPRAERFSSTHLLASAAQRSPHSLDLEVFKCAFVLLNMDRLLQNKSIQTDHYPRGAKGS